ncbi:MAG: hypothetical protein JXB07_03710 [Anaerolineae bacterium]|nr:hypothetical protein [Anaerolineae bacterium]
MTRAILTCSPYFIDPALNEIRRHHSQITVIQSISPGYSLLDTPGSFEELTRPWRHRLPIYLHHLFPVHVDIPLEAAFDDLKRLKQAIRRIAPSKASVQVRSTVEIETPGVLEKIQRYLAGNHVCHRPEPPTGQIVSVLIAPEQAGQRAYLGVSWAAHNLSPWAGGQIPVTEPVANRAGYKLLEAIATFSIRLKKGDQALDLGAAPGAWTTLLRRRGLKVTAVAPTPLYPWLAFDAGVSYQPMLAQEYLECCRTVFGVIVNDMRLDAQDSARLMVDYAAHLRQDGVAVMTLKLRSRNQQRVMDHAFRILRQAYRIIRVRQLISNRHEVTLFLRHKAAK